MTKKFWNDWKSRFGETSQVWYLEKHGKYVFENSLLEEYNGDKIIKADFHDGTVDLVIERHTTVWNGNILHQQVQNEYLTLKRKYIVTIEFKKRNTI